MPDINTTQSVATNTASTGTSITKEKADSGNDFNTFLSLLTAQMRNQDPLKPLDSTDFVAQLASFSAVEQQIRTNDQLAELIGMGASNPSTSMADWIGKEVRHRGQTDYSGTPIDIGPAVHPLADAAVLVVKDNDGNTVFRQPFDTSQSTLEWNGDTTSGSASSGRYSFEVESFLEDEHIFTEIAPVFDAVVEVRQQNGALLLAFEDGSTMLSDEVTAMRLPQ